MSEVNLSAMAAIENDEPPEKTSTPMQEMDMALRECKFGWFHLRLLGSVFIGIVANVLISNTAYIIPNAECDLNMNLVKKGFLNAVPYIGMLLSSMVAGFLSDTFGRKKFLLTGYGGIFVFSLIAGSSQSYEVLVTAKLLEGVLMATSFNAMFAMTSEFCHKGIRDRMLLCQSALIGVAQIIIAGFSWIILTQDWHLSLGNGAFVLNTWNFYLFLCSLWSLSAFVLYTLLPESPKYLLSQEMYDEAKAVLLQIYKENTGKSADSYPAKSLWKDLTITKNKEKAKVISFKSQIMAGLSNSKPMFYKPLALYLIITCLMGFLSLLIFNVSRLWFPQLSTIIEHYTKENNGTQELCIMLDAYTSNLQHRKNNASDICIPHKSGNETYINSLILGTVCIIPYLLSGILINKVGKKPLQFTAAVITVVCILALRWSNSKPLLVFLFSIIVALSQAVVSLCQNIIVETFPTTTRSFAISMVMMSGRTGTLVGNIAFPILLNMGCVVPFYTMTGFMICVCVLTLVLPTKK